MQVRRELPADQAAIHALHLASFPTGAEAALVDALRAAGTLRISLVADEAGAVLGHVAFSPVELARSAGGKGLGLAPLAVLAEQRRQGVGEQLVRAGLDECRRLGVYWVVVVGDPAAAGTQKSTRSPMPSR